MEVNAHLPLCKNTVGILYYDYEMEGAALCGYLRSALGVDIIACSTIATVNNKDGYRDMVATLTLLTADDCEFHLGVTRALNDENVLDSLQETFTNTKKNAKMDIGLMYTWLPCSTNIIFDEYIGAFSKMAGDVPIIGGVPTDLGCAERSMVFNGDFYAGRAIILLISGNIKPVIALASAAEPLSDRQETVTKANGTVIYEMEDKSFAEYIESYGMNIREFERNESRIFFQKYPLLVYGAGDEGKNGEKQPAIRIIDSIDWKDGSGVAYASIPQGAKASLAILHKELIARTVKQGLEELFSKIAKSGRQYAVILCITCAARHFILNPEYAKEGDVIKKMVPDAYQLSGFYSYGELCPVAVEEGKACNRLHNGSIVFCAI
ncbi:MAG: FIST N-terminal domain-containing protein [Christensenella sp.]|uniref:FIST C-terminal domain-containing protein n=1 Tax=Christensenella sp. TaxID=1935934 RepID=UPI002B21CA75|nr:FIST C-terminal domain-containing protein [Christensenella sp.]MEA5004053.1 FIST N-terminal domain-containing protein [Christensenella sp.]